MDFSQYIYQFNNPWAAYLLPNDIELCEQLFIWDVIGDRVGTRGYLRQGQAIGTWTGDGFDIPVQEPEVWVGWLTLDIHADSVNVIYF